MADTTMTVHDLHVARDGKVIASVPDFTLAAGQSVALIGQSGSGKTTALMALAGIRPPAQGRIVINGTDPWALSSGQRDRFRGRQIGLVFQTFHLVDAVSVQANLELAASCAGLKVDRHRIDFLLDRLGLQTLKHRKPRQLSQGQAQRVAVARALVNGPALIVADEPTSALDDGNTHDLLGLLREMATDAQAALLIATHDHRVMGEVDRVIAMEVQP